MTPTRPTPARQTIAEQAETVIARVRFLLDRGWRVRIADDTVNHPSGAYVHGLDLAGPDVPEVQTRPADLLDTSK